MSAANDISLSLLRSHPKIRTDGETRRQLTDAFLVTVLSGEGKSYTHGDLKKERHVGSKTSSQVNHQQKTCPVS